MYEVVLKKKGEISTFNKWITKIWISRSLYKKKKKIESKFRLKLNNNKKKQMENDDIRRIMKKVLPSDLDPSEEAVHSMRCCLVDFLALVLGEALSSCKKDLVTSEDMVHALQKLGFEDYSEICELYWSKLKSKSTASS